MQGIGSPHHPRRRCTPTKTPFSPAVILKFPELNHAKRTVEEESNRMAKVYEWDLGCVRDFAQTSVSHQADNGLMPALESISNRLQSFKSLIAFTIFPVQTIGVEEMGDLHGATEAATKPEDAHANDTESMAVVCD